MNSLVGSLGHVAADRACRLIGQPICSSLSQFGSVVLNQPAFPVALVTIAAIGLTSAIVIRRHWTASIIKQELASIARPDNKTEQAVYQFTIIGEGTYKSVYRVEGTNWVIKIPTIQGKIPPMYRNEYIAHQINEQFDLDVVPFVALLNDRGENVQKESELFKQHPSLKKQITDKFGSQLMILQEYLPNPINYEIKFDKDNAHKILFFNMIVGRNDGRDVNSMMCSNGHIWEVDNDMLGNKCSSVIVHWLYYDLKYASISEKILNHITSLQPIALDELADVDKLLDTINSNLASVQSAIKCLRNQRQEVTFYKLINLIYNNQFI